MSSNSSQKISEISQKLSSSSPLASKLILIVMGPSACGKSQVGSSLANYFHCKYIEGDSFHSKESIHKMENGISLTDEDRLPWLNRLAKEIGNYVNDNEDETLQNSKLVQVVLACSALKKLYRDVLKNYPLDNNKQQSHNSSSSRSKVVFIYLDCSKSVLEQRINSRQNHFMKVNLLESQLATLENPLLDQQIDGHDGINITNNNTSCTISVNGDMELQDILDHVITKLNEIK